MAKVWLKAASWGGNIQRVSNGWLITLVNLGAVPGGVLVRGVEFKIPFGRTDLARGATLEFISEPLANPGAEVLLLLKVKEEKVLELVGNSIILHLNEGTTFTFELT